MNNASSVIKVTDLGINYDDQQVVDGVSFHLQKGQLACLLGPSGCGKTSILRSIAGFVPLNSGSIEINGTLVSSKNTFLAPEKRNIGMVFQDYALFPHLSVAKNVGFGIKAGAKHLRVKEIMELVGLAHLAERYPHELSGGQQQRIALARALVPKPDVVLLDEPFSNLDVDLRESLSQQIKDIFNQTQTTAIFVTHSHQEAFSLADQIGVLENGKMQQWDTPYNIYHEPSNSFVAKFIGQGTFLPATMTAPDTFESPLGVIKGDRAYPWQKGAKVQLLIRPDDVIFDEASDKKARIIKRVFQGPDILYHIKIQEDLVVPTIVPSHHEMMEGELFPYQIDAMHLVAFLDQ